MRVFFCDRDRRARKAAENSRFAARVTSRFRSAAARRRPGRASGGWRVSGLTGRSGRAKFAVGLEDCSDRGGARDGNGVALGRGPGLKRRRHVRRGEIEGAGFARE